MTDALKTDWISGGFRQFLRRQLPVGNLPIFPLWRWLTFCSNAASHCDDGAGRSQDVGRKFGEGPLGIEGGG